ncbi:MAG: TIR domain-containing protein [Candidatus Dormibacteria bacterium]
MNRILLAGALDMGAASSDYRDLIAAANKFGLISGNYNSENLSLTDLGDRLTAADSEEARLSAMREAMERVALFKKMLDHYNNGRLPSPTVLKGALEQPPFNVPSEWSAEAAKIFEETGRLTGVVRAMKGGTPYVVREAGPPVRDEASGHDVADDVATDGGVEEATTGTTAVAAETPSAPATPAAATPAPASSRQFFIAHGKDKDALAQLQTFLRDLDVPYVVAEEEPNAGRPISQKIADLMRSCSAGIFIFSGDEEVTDAKGDLVRRPRPNVVYELGAASFQYGQRIVVFKEQGVEFPTDFRDLGYIEYEKGRLGAKSMELLRELIKLKAVRVMPGG